MRESRYIDIPYTWDYHPALNPLRLRLAFLNVGLKPPTITTACELGYGRGVSLAVHAAASTVNWYGTDMNPVHAASARQLAIASGADIKAYADSFSDFSTRSDLPKFDFIGLHGVWSWISDANRTEVVRFINRMLTPGGVLYVGYNALPGWGAFLPLRQLLVEHAAQAGSEDPRTGAHVDGAIAFVERLLATNPAIAQDAPRLLEVFENMKQEGSAYVAHEFLTLDWEPMFFSTVARQLSPAELKYVCAADFSDYADFHSMSPAQRRLVEEILDPELRQLVRDSIYNKRFRRDYWVRRPERLSEVQRDNLIRNERIILVQQLSELPFNVRAVLELRSYGSDIEMASAIFDILNVRKPLCVGEIEELLPSRGVPLLRIFDAVVFLASCGLIETAQEQPITEMVRPRTDKLNDFLVDRARADGEVHDLASPVTGGAVHVSRAEQLFLSALRDGKARPDEWAIAAFEFMPEADLLDLMEGAKTFANERLPVLQALRIA
jgi:SAM-dependent methyltransferase